MTEQLVISALGEDKPGIVKSVSKNILDCGGNITESRMSVLGGEFALMVLVTGDENELSRIESRLGSLQESLGLTVISRRTRKLPGRQAGVPYKVEVISMDHPGIVHDVTDYLAQHQINVEELETTSYAAAHTGTPMFSLQMQIAIPVSMNISEFRKNFSHFCDDLNLDVSFGAKR